MAKDKRVKGCSNPDCEKANKKAKFKAEENYCSICGSTLVYVCAQCHGPLDDEGPDHRICGGCEATNNDRKAKAINGVKKAVGVVGGVTLTAFGVLAKKK